MTKISELGLCKNECCADKIRAAMKAGTAYGRATPTLSAAMELPEVSALVEALERIADTDPDDGTSWFHDQANTALSQLKEPKT
jgi:hypothetical protein